VKLEKVEERGENGRKKRGRRGRGRKGEKIAACDSWTLNSWIMCPNF
jgi:hypothetical protein